MLQELNRRLGKKQKQAAWRLERIPSSVVVHKRIDSTDTRWMQQSATLKDNPLEHNLGFFDFGRYHKAADGSKHAFEKIGELMGFEIDSDGEDSEEDDEVGTTMVWFLHSSLTTRLNRLLRILNLFSKSKPAPRLMFQDL